MMLSSLTSPASGMQSTTVDKSQALLDGLKSVAQVDLSKMSTKEKVELEEKCQEFESLFIKMLLDTMRKSVQRTESESGASKQGKDIYEDMLYSEYATSMSKAGDGLGIGKMIYRQLTTPVISAAEIARRYNQQ